MSAWVVATNFRFDRKALFVACLINCFVCADSTQLDMQPASLRLCGNWLIAGSTWLVSWEFKSSIAHINRSRNNAGKPRTTGGSLTIRTQALLQLSNALHVVLYIHEAKASIRYTHTHLHEIVPSLWNTICQCTILILDWSYRKFEKYFDTGQTAAPLPV